MSEPEASDEGLEAGAGATRSEQIRRALLPPIQSICSALGGNEDEIRDDGELVRVYKVGDECLTCLKDLKRFWRMDDDDDDRTVARLLAETNVLANDLLPILQVSIGTGSRGNKIALACADLIGAMTWPIDVVEELREAELQDQQQEKIDYSSLLAAHLAYKAAILRSGALAQLFQLLVPTLEKARRDRTERDHNIVSLILHIIRNLAAIKDRQSTAQSSAEALELSTLQSELVIQLHTEHFFRLLLTIASNSEGSEWGPWNMVTLDILHLLFRGVLPSDVASAISKGQAEAQALDTLLSAELRLHKAEKRKAVSRHSRFGTTLTLAAGDRRYAMHQQAAVALSPSKVIDSLKKSKAKRGRQENELATPSRYRSDALVTLRNFSVAFVENSLNSFFLSVLKDIRLEREKTRETDNVRVLVLATFFLDFFLLLQKHDKDQGIDMLSTEGHSFELVTSLTDTQAIGYVMARMRLAREEKPPLWNELHASVECFTQLLLTIDALSQSPSEEQKDVGITLQNKLYYDAVHLDIVLEVLAEYKNQSKRYLDAIVHLTYVLMRMLERYSKNTDAMYVRRKRKAKRTGRSVEEVEDGDNEPKMTLAEHAFRFDEYEQRLANEHTLHTLMTCLAGYRTFTSEEQIKRLVNLMYRIAIKAKAEGIFFKVSVLGMFHRIISDRKTLPRMQPYQDLMKLIDHILKRFFKVAKERPLILLEIWYPHRKGDIKRMMRGEDPTGAHSESDEEQTSLNLPAELEFKIIPELSESKRMGIAVAAISDLNKEYLLDWVKDALRITASQREEIVLNTDGLPEELPLDENGEQDADAIKASRAPKGPSEEAKSKFEEYEVPYPDDDMVKAGTRDVHLKLLLRLLQWESADRPGRLVWSIPVSRMPADLAADIRIIDNFLINPLDNETGKAAVDMLRRKRKPRPRGVAGGEPEGQLDALSDNDTSGNRRGGVVNKGARGRKRAEELKSYKSAQFIEDSDDEDLDAFYQKEAELKKRNMAGAGHTTASQMPGPKKGKGKKRKSAVTSASASGDEATGSSSVNRKQEHRRQSKFARKAYVATTSPSSPGSQSQARASTPPSSLAQSSPSSTGKGAASPDLAFALLHSTAIADHDQSDDAVGDFPPSSGRFARKETPPKKRAKYVIAGSDDD